MPHVFTLLWTPDRQLVLARLLLAMLAGSAIGFERSYHGRPAGFRTHTLVCSGSALLMLFATHAPGLMPASAAVRIDPVRMAQGIMTGIGFLGAGAIMKESVSVRGLTTAASIWITASIGVVLGSGFYFAGIAAVGLTVGVLGAFRWLESVMPTLAYAQLTVRCRTVPWLPEEELRALVAAHGASMSHARYHTREHGALLEYQATVRAGRRGSYRALAATLTHHPSIEEFSLVPNSD